MQQCALYVLGESCTQFQNRLFQPTDVPTEKTASGRFPNAIACNPRKVVTGDKSEMLLLPFKVLKAKSTVTLEVEMAGYINEATNEMIELTDRFIPSDLIIGCSHKNTETKTQIEDCEKGGKTVTVCKDCGETVKTENIVPTEHKVDKWTESKKPTCPQRARNRANVPYAKRLLPVQLK